MKDFKDWGSGIPAYFGLMRFYNVIAFLVFLVNAVYPMVITYMVCEHLNQDNICVEIGFLRYLAFGDMKEALEANGKQNIADVPY